jgi:hypothetical protein
LSTKLHVIVDGCGLPIRVVLSPGQASDKAVAPALLAGLAPGRDLVADRGYDAKALLDLIAAPGRARPHPDLPRSQAPALGRSGTLPPSQPRRALLQQAQALPPHRHPLREDRAKLPRRRPHRINPPVDTL